jgi:UDP-N-acetylglucosamine diphosphorylase/glucosamine-1-phosphate N-acetyltransferase
VYALEHPETRVNDPAWLEGSAAVLVQGRWLTPDRPSPTAGGPCLGLVGDEIAYAVVGPEQLQQFSLATCQECLESWRKSLPSRAVGGELITFPWDLVEANGPQISRDFARVVTGRAGAVLGDIGLVGRPDRVWLHPSARIEPMVLADTTEGPVLVAEGAHVAAFTRLQGPCYVGPNTRVHAAQIRAGTTLGPDCRIGGEVEASIIQGHTNKSHDGFLGHSYLGEWINLGAGTTNSDLRNDYGSVSVPIHGQATSTGRTKVGCFIGDHTKTGLGTLLNTGSVIGAFCNLLPAGPLAPRYLPPFTTWWHGNLRENADWRGLLATARTAMARRQHTLTDAHSALYLHIYEETIAERRRVLRDREQRQWRRSA